MVLTKLSFVVTYGQRRSVWVSTTWLDVVCLYFLLDLSVCVQNRKTFSERPSKTNHMRACSMYLSSSIYKE